MNIHPDGLKKLSLGQSIKSLLYNNKEVDNYQLITLFSILSELLEMVLQTEFLTLRKLIIFSVGLSAWFQEKSFD